MAADGESLLRELYDEVTGADRPHCVAPPPLAWAETRSRRLACAQASAWRGCGTRTTGLMGI